MSGTGGRAQAKVAPALDFGGLGLTAAPAAPDPVPQAAPAAAGPATAPLPPPAAAVPAPRAGGRTAVREPAAAPKRRRPRRRVTNPADDGTGVSLPIAVVKRLRAFRGAAAGRTYTGVVLDALEATHGQLADLLAPALPPARSGPLFSGRAPRRTTAHGDGHQAVNLRFGDEDLRVIDDLWPAVGAPSRSAMLSAALDAYLPPEAN